MGQKTTTEKLFDVAITIKGIDGSKDPARTLSATCVATTFMFREEAVPPLGN